MLLPAGKTSRKKNAWIYCWTEPRQYSKLILWFRQMSFCLCCLWNDHRLRWLVLFFCILAFLWQIGVIPRMHTNNSSAKYICCCLVRATDLREANCKTLELHRRLKSIDSVHNDGSMETINHIVSQTLAWKNSIASCAQCCLTSVWPLLSPLNVLNGFSLTAWWPEENTSDTFSYIS